MDVVRINIQMLYKSLARYPPYNKHACQTHTHKHKYAQQVTRDGTNPYACRPAPVSLKQPKTPTRTKEPLGLRDVSRTSATTRQRACGDCFSTYNQGQGVECSVPAPCSSSHSAWRVPLKELHIMYSRGRYNMVLINTYCPVHSVANEVSKNTINQNKQEHKPTDTEANCTDWIIDCPHGYGLSNRWNQTICLVSFLTLITAPLSNQRACYNAYGNNNFSRDHVKNMWRHTRTACIQRVWKKHM